MFLLTLGEYRGQLMCGKMKDTKGEIVLGKEMDNT
jgi:hypothetical protein